MKEHLKLVFDLSTTLLIRTKTPHQSKPTPQAIDDTEQIDTSSYKKPTNNGSTSNANKLTKEETKSSGTPLMVVSPQVDDGGKLEDLKVVLGDRVRDAIRKGLVQAMVTADTEKGGRG